jgi:FAD/FMN-containing dehydrogenase
MPAVLTSLIVMPGDPGWDDARRAWNLAVDQHPAAVARPRSADDVAEVVGFARRYGLRVAAQGTGHNAAPLGLLADTVLVRTERMRPVSIDPVARIARAEAGAVWRDVVEAAAGPGLAANNVEAIELVTADGRLVRADAGTEPDLFWALRGGGGSFGVVTAIELRLFPVSEVYAGRLWWPAEAAAEVLQAWRQLTQGGLPDEFTSSAQLLNVPLGLPGHQRGRSSVVVNVIHLGEPAEADRLLGPLRALQPATDTVRVIPARALNHLHMDPEQPSSVAGDGLMLASLPAEAVETLVRVAGPGSGAALAVAEVRHIGGEMRRARPGHGALAAIDAEYALFAGGPAPFPQAASAVTQNVAAMQTAMRPWAARQMYLNFAETARDPASFWPPQAFDRLRRIKAAVDPGNLIRSNHPVPALPVLAPAGRLPRAAEEANVDASEGPLPCPPR